MRVEDGLAGVRGRVAAGGVRVGKVRLRRVKCLCDVWVGCRGGCPGLVKALASGADLCSRRHWVRCHGEGREGWRWGKESCGDP